MPKYIEGTNIPISKIKGNVKGGAAYWSQRLRESDNPNDVLFDMAYTTPFKGKKPTSDDPNDKWQGQGGGNPNVGSLQSGRWKMNTGQTWAEQAVKSPSGRSDIYKQRDPVTGDLTGKVIRGADYGTKGNRGYVPPKDRDDNGGDSGGDSNIVVQPVNREIPNLAELTDDMMLSNKVTELINRDSPLYRAAATKAMQRMQKRGILNSSLAYGEVDKAIMAVALPIAQAEVQALQQNLYYNTDWTNKDKFMANEAAYNRMLAQLQGSINMQLQKFISGQQYGLQQLVGQQKTALQELMGTQATTLQELVGAQELNITQQKLRGEYWSKYGDWITDMATTEGADQDAWKQMMDMLVGSGGWPSLT